MGALGVRPIDYHPWRGERSDPQWRFLVISRSLFRRALRSKGVLVVLILGILLVYAFPIIGAVLFPHEELTNKDMIGTKMEVGFGGSSEYLLNVTGDLTIDPDVVVDGTFTVNDTFFLENASFELHGSIDGMGAIWTNSSGSIETMGEVQSQGLVDFTGFLQVTGNLSGNGKISGTGRLMGNGTVVGIVTEPEGSGARITIYQGGLLTGGVFGLFIILLAAIICSDVISEDLADSSFVLYFSRPVRTVDYLAGKAMGLLMVMSIFCLLLPLLYVLVMMGTQSGNDYGGGMAILGKTFLVGLLTAVFYLPYGLLISSITRRKAYAGIGIFASFFVLLIVATMFGSFDAKWLLLDPSNMLQYTYVATFGQAIPNGIGAAELAATMLAITLVPMAIVYWLLDRRGGGR